MSELEQLRDENRQKQRDLDALQTAYDGVCRVMRDRDEALSRLRNNCRCVANALRDWSARHGYPAKIDALATVLQVLAQPAPAPAEGQQPEPASDGEVEANKWKAAITEAAVVNWTLTAENENDPRKAVNALLCYAQHVALDPQVSEDARTLRDTYKPEVERLRAIVAKLPKTADGVPVVPGMKVWKMHRDVVHGIEVKDWGRCRGVCSLRIGMATYNLTPDETYSTRDAAIAASKGEVQHG